jgi:guanylate kinase
MKGKLFVISGPSGVGKTTLVNQVVEQLELPFPFKRVVTYTTRAPRSAEKEGNDYYFVTSSQFIDLQKQDFFIATSTTYRNYYGMDASFLKGLEEGVSYIVILDRQGAHEVRSFLQEAVLIWLAPLSMTVVKERLEKRAQEDINDVQKRVALGYQEMEEEIKVPFYDYHLINENIDQLLIAIKNIVYKERGFKEEKKEEYKEV